MGLLDELRQEAETRRREEEEQQTHVAKDRVEVRPRMETIAAYLRELAEHLNYLKPTIQAGYDVEGFGRVDKLLQHDYHIGEFQDAMRSFSLSFVCSGKRTYQVLLKRAEDIERIEDYMRHHGLTYRAQEFRGEEHRLEEAKLLFTPLIDVVILFEAQQETSTIDVIFSNFFKIGTERLTFKAKLVDEPFLEELGKSILRQDNNLIEYQRFYLSENMRDRIRAKIRGDEMQREIEARVSERNDSVLGSAKRTPFARILDRLMGDLSGKR
jgi:hypothetical protein